MDEKHVKKVDWLLLIFLWLFTNQAILSLKIVGLVFVYIARPNLEFRLAERRLPLFYVFLPLLAIFTFLFITHDFSSEYIIAFIVGNLFWVFSFLAAHQVKLSVERHGPETIYRTVKVFTAVNILFCLLQLGSIMLKTQTINPYNETIPFPYGMSTGDNIYGTFMQNSYYNVMVSSLLTIYFIFKRNIAYAVMASICLIFVFGNFGTMLFIGILVSLFLTGIMSSFINGDKEYPAIPWLKRIAPPGRFYIYIPLMLLLTTCFYVVLSPKNFNYVVDKFKEKIFTIKSREKHNYATMIDNQKMKAVAFDPFSSYFDQVEDSLKKTEEYLNNTSYSGISAEDKLSAQKELTRIYISKLQGKNLSVFETINYLKSSPKAFLFGAGTTRFSSLTAQKMSGYDSSRLFMNVLPHYKSKLYAENHFLLIEGREHAGDDALLSTANWPDSLYNQLFGEYGVLGAMIFVLFYIGFFVRDVRYWTYSFWLFFILLPFAHLNYVFETLCVIPFFELLTEADIMEHFQKNKQHVEQ